MQEVTWKQYKDMKMEARRQRSENIDGPTYNQILEQMARAKGFRTLAAMRASMKPIEENTP